MSQDTTGDVLSKFQAEIERSAVISDSFKEWLVNQMVEMAVVAYRKGQAEGVKEERDSKKTKEPS